MERAIPRQPNIRKNDLPFDPNKIKAKEISIFCNHYDLNLNSVMDTSIYQWSAKFHPDLVDDSRQVINEIFQENRREIRQQLGITIRSPDALFSLKEPQNKILIFNEHPLYQLELSKTNRNMTFRQLDRIDSSKQEILRILNINVKYKMK